MWQPKTRFEPNKDIYKGYNDVNYQKIFVVLFFTIFNIVINKLAFGETRFPDAADHIEHISEENFLLQIFAKMETLLI